VSAAPLSTRRVGILANANSGRHGAGALGAELTTLLRRDGHEVIDLSAPDLGTARSRSTAAVAGGAVDTLVAIGGDGTAHLAANVCAGQDVALGILAAGTGNDNARTLGMPRGDVAAMARLVTVGATRQIDLGVTRTPAGDRHFLGVLGGGFDTLVNDRGKTLRLLHGTPRYLAAVALELPRFRGIPYAVQVDDVTVDTTAMLVAVGNGGCFGGGMQVCPDADVADGLFDVMVLHQIGRLEFLKIFPKVFSGGHVGHPAVQILRGRRVTLDSPGIRSQADGEDFLPLPLQLDVAAGALTILAT
jgi:diacylglycerol kinase (ATP)